MVTQTCNANRPGMKENRSPHHSGLHSYVKTIMRYMGFYHKQTRKRGTQTWDPAEKRP